MIPLPKSCRGCTLDHELGYSELEGDGTGGLMTIAEALGKHEEEEGLPLRPDARAGGVFQRAVEMAGLARPSMTLTNIVRCRPPGNELKGMPWYREAVDHCRPYLDAAVAERKPRMLLALGDVPFQELSVHGGTLSELRGYVLESVYGVPLIATYHPSHIARGASHLFGVMMHDLKVAQTFASKGVPKKRETNYNLNPSIRDAQAFCDRVLRSPERSLAHDLETVGILGCEEPKAWREKQIIQIQFSLEPGEAIVFPWVEPYIAIAREIFKGANVKLGWNDRFSDRLVLKAHGFKFGGEMHDLMNAWAHLQPGFMSGKDSGDDEDKGVPAKLMGLQSCASFYYPHEGPWKHSVPTCPYDEGTPEREAWLESEAWPTLRLYGAKDADMTRRLGDRLFRDLKALGVW